MAMIAAEIDRANKDMKKCVGGAVDAATKPKRKNTPGCGRLREAEAEKDALLAQFTSNHPSVIAVEGKIRDLERQCDREQDPSDTVRPGASQSECIAASKARVTRLTEQKLELERGASKKPKLERRWAELNLELSALDTEWTAYKETYRRVNKERLLAANEFRDSFVLVDQPRVPELPSYPDRTQFMAFGMAITFIAGVFLATSREALRQTFADSREVEEQTGVPVLVALPNISEGESPE